MRPSSKPPTVYATRFALGIHPGRHVPADRRAHQDQRDLLAKLKIAPPKKIIEAIPVTG